ncbi:MAG: FtsL-like putative cell division protein [Bacteroidota bacterium]
MKTTVRNKYRTPRDKKKGQGSRNRVRRTKQEPTTPSRSLFTRMEDAVRIDTSLERGLPVRFAPYILYFTIIGLFYIGNNHYAERMILKHNRLEREVEDLRANYTTLKAGYMLESKQSEVAKRVERLGLVESEIPPYKIIVTKP